jgi:hypothetical protein
MPTLNQAYIQFDAPNAWKQFTEFYQESVQPYPKLRDISIEDLPMEMLVGLFVRFFRENGMELDVSNFEFEDLSSVIEDNFKVLQQTMQHFS